MEALSGKTVLLVTHQVDFLPAFDSVLVSLISITGYFSLKSFTLMLESIQFKFTYHQRLAIIIVCLICRRLDQDNKFMLIVVDS